MGPRKAGVAATLRDKNGQQTKRQIRFHGFIGAHTEGMWKDALAVEVKKSSRSLEVTLKNPHPHALPSGFGSREILIEMQYIKGGKVIDTEKRSLTSRYLNKRGKPTIPHLAAKTVENVSVPAYGEKTFSLPLVQGAEKVSVSVSYRLVNDEVREILDLKDPIWSKKMVIKKLYLTL